MTPFALLALLAASASGADTPEFSCAVRLRRADPRVEVAALDPERRADDGLRAAARGLVLVLEEDDIVDDGGQRPYVSTRPAYMCPGERFADRVTAGTSPCTAFVIARDRVATAGHCIDPCAARDVRLVDAKVARRDARSPWTISRDEVRRVKQVITWRDDTQGDYAVLLVTPPYPRDRVLDVDRSRPRTGERWYALGFPFGMPAQATRCEPGMRDCPDGEVLSVGPHFVDVDVATANGNSGGPLVRHDGTVRALVAGRLGSEIVCFESPSMCMRYVGPQRPDRAQRIDRVITAPPWRNRCGRTVSH